MTKDFELMTKNFDLIKNFTRQMKNFHGKYIFLFASMIYNFYERLKNFLWMKIYILELLIILVLIKKIIEWLIYQILPGKKDFDKSFMKIVTIKNMIFAVKNMAGMLRKIYK